MAKPIFPPMKAKGMKSAGKPKMPPFGGMGDPMAAPATVGVAPKPMKAPMVGRSRKGKM